jgi:nucleotide-binding universal stress UspA family protein
MKILIAYDGSACADAALDNLRRAGLPEQGEAIVLSVGRASPLLSEGATPRDTAAIAHEELANAEALSARAANRVRADLPAWRVTSEAVVESPQWAIVQKADAWQPDLVVVGSHGRSAIGRAILGSVSQSVLTHVACSVRIARRGASGGGAGPVRLVVGIDGSVESATAVSAVALRRWPNGSEARVVAVVETPEPLMKLPVSARVTSVSDSPHQWVTRAVDRVAQELRDAGLSVSPLVCQGDPKRVLVDESERWDADCIFVGAKGLSRLDRFLLGSVSLAVAVRAHCSVEVVRQPS